MKKLYVSILAVCVSGLSFAQNAFTISTPLTATNDLVTPLATNVTGDTAEFFNADQFSSIIGPLVIVNPAGTGKDVKVRRTQLSVVPGSSNFFCWDLCYTSIVSVSGGTVNIAANDSVFVFYADYDPAGNSGSTYVNYKFYNNSDTTQFASVTVKFTSGTVSIEEEAAVIANVYPNPASQLINFDYTLGNHQGSISISDLTGKVVKSVNLPENSAKHVISLDGLTDGIYIYTFYSDGKAISTKKFIIKK
jgi:hypothetical protein